MIHLIVAVDNFPTFPTLAFQSGIIFAPPSQRQTRSCFLSSNPSNHKPHNTRICLEISAKETINTFEIRKKEVVVERSNLIWEQAKAIAMIIVTLHSNTIV